MSDKAPHVTDAELEVLKVLWDAGLSTIREITDRIYPDGGTSHYATVQKLLERLETKQFVRRRSGGRANRYLATVGRDRLVASRLEETAARLCEGSFTPLVAQLVDSRRLGADDLAALRGLVDRLEREAAGDGPEGS